MATELAVAPVSSVTQPYWSTPLRGPYEGGTGRGGLGSRIPPGSMICDLAGTIAAATNSPSYDCTARRPGAPNYASLGFIGWGTTCGFPTITITGFSGNVLGGATGTAYRTRAAMCALAG